MPGTSSTTQLSTSSTSPQNQRRHPKSICAHLQSQPTSTAGRAAELTQLTCLCNTTRSFFFPCCQSQVCQWLCCSLDTEPIPGINFCSLCTEPLQEPFPVGNIRVTDWQLCYHTDNSPEKHILFSNNYWLLVNLGLKRSSTVFIQPFFFSMLTCQTLRFNFLKKKSVKPVKQTPPKI